MKKLDADKHYKSYLYMGHIWVGIVLIMLFLTSCYGTYYITDAEYSDLREEHAAVTYYDNQIYWGWNSGYYYYYGMPHYYPWTYYYNTCPPSHHTHTTHIVITRPVNKPTHRPNIRTNTRVTVTPNTNIKINRTNNKVKTNRSNTNKVKSNRTSNTRTKSTNRKPR